jgi:putative glutamine amidotransferase
MQMMALHAGGTLNQHLPETHASAASHRGVHTIVVSRGVLAAAARNADGAVLPLAPGEVFSNHHQGVSDPGPMEILARSPDEVIEAIADPRRRFYCAVQWHPERTANASLGPALFRPLVAAAS